MSFEEKSINYIATKNSLIDAEVGNAMALL
jgi:hypothetical protein